ncbi:MAG: hypothetical protein U0354_02870 [Candidatus Sericytochromatia bacterium]
MYIISGLFLSILRKSTRLIVKTLTFSNEITEDDLGSPSRSDISPKNSLSFKNPKICSLPSLEFTTILTCP